MTLNDPIVRPGNGAPTQEMTMTETNPEVIEGKKRPVEKLDMSRPVAILLHQTESRNNIEVLAARDDEDAGALMRRAYEVAAEAALRLERPVAVFGPQVAVKIPPAVIHAGDMPLRLGKPPKSHTRDMPDAAE